MRPEVQEAILRLHRIADTAPTKSRDQVLAEFQSAKEFFDDNVVTIDCDEVTGMLDALMIASDAVNSRIRVLTAH